MIGRRIDLGVVLQAKGQRFELEFGVDPMGGCFLKMKRGLSR
jgi:hypothetical protein